MQRDMTRHLTPGLLTFSVGWARGTVPTTREVTDYAQREGRAGENSLKPKALKSVGFVVQKFGPPPLLLILTPSVDSPVYRPADGLAREIYD